MNIRLNFKQSWTIIKQNKLFSGIYIFGTAISIAMVMVIAIIWLSKTAEMYPEVNRSRMMSVKGLMEYTMKNGKIKSSSSSRISHKFAEDFIRTIPQVECATEVLFNPEPLYLGLAGEDARYKVMVTNTDFYFWKVFEFKFLAGSPYTEEEVKSTITKAVISEKIADTYFGSAQEAVGKHFALDFVDYTVCGVVKNVSAVMSASYADIWTPITTISSYGRPFGATGYLGNAMLYLLAHSSKDFNKITNEVGEKIAAFNNASEDNNYQLDLFSQPEPYARGLLRVYSNEIVDVNAYILKIVLVVFLLLFIPAINLAGMISSRMTKRLEEVGIRKAFGAPKKSILFQITNENLLLTCIGGVVGIALSYLILALGGHTLMGLIVPSTFSTSIDAVFTLSMLMNPWVFVVAFAICLILNLLSAIIPAVHSLRKNIVDSLNVKK